MSAMWSIVFDERAQGRAVLERIESVHTKVRGAVPAGEPSFAGVRFGALDQDLLLWVHATLIDSAMIAYARFVAPLAPGEKNAYYDDSKKLASLFGINDAILPPVSGEFEAYMQRMMAGDAIAVGPTAKSLAHDILYARPWIFKVAGPLFRFVTAGLLPEKLREGYGLKWTARKEKKLVLLAGAIRASLPWLPAPIRIVPNARAAEKRFRR